MKIVDGNRSANVFLIVDTIAASKVQSTEEKNGGCILISTYGTLRKLNLLNKVDAAATRNLNHLFFRYFFKVCLDTFSRKKFLSFLVSSRERCFKEQ